MWCRWLSQQLFTLSTRVRVPALEQVLANTLINGPQYMVYLRYKKISK
jgi:hypothetical protein